MYNAKQGGKNIRAAARIKKIMELVNLTYLLRKAQALRVQSSNKYEQLWYQGYIAAIELMIKYLKGGESK